MENDKKNELPGPEHKKGESLEDKIHRHLSNKNDIITNEDIRDIKVGEISVPGTEEKNKKMNDEIPRDKMITPWDILDEE